MDGGDGNDWIDVTYVIYQPKVNTTVIHGGAGDDIIQVARWGNAAIAATGGEGADIYQLFSTSRLDTLTIKDFVAGAGGDRIGVRALFTAGMRATDPYAAGVLLLVKNGASTMIALDLDGKAGPDTGFVLATVENVTAAAIKDSIVYLDAAPVALVGQAPGAAWLV